MRDVLIICEYPTLNGGERSMFSTLPHIAAAGYRVTVAAPPTGQLTRELQHNAIAHVPLDLCDSDGRRVDQPVARERIGRAMLQVAPDLVHANSLSMGRLTGPVAANQHVRSISHLRDIIGLSGRALADLNQNTRLIAVSHATRDFHVGAGLDPGRTHVVYNGVDLLAFSPDHPSPESLRHELGVDNDALLVATIGQVIARKGTDLFVKAAIQISRRRPNSHFLIVGECYSRKDEALQFHSDLRQAVQAQGADTHVHFVGYRSDMAGLLNQVDLVVQPSRQDPLCRVLLEAAATGKAIVAADVGGTREIFPAAANAAVVVAQNDVVTLTETIDSLLDDTTRRVELGKNARRRAEEAFDLRHAAAQLVKQYDEVLASPM